MASEKQLMYVELDGERLRPRDTIFVVFNPAGVPVGTVPGANVAKDSRVIAEGYLVARAARAYWLSENVALEKLNEGYCIRHMTFVRFCTELAAKMQPEES